MVEELQLEVKRPLSHSRSTVMAVFDDCDAQTSEYDQGKYAKRYTNVAAGGKGRSSHCRG